MQKIRERDLEDKIKRTRTGSANNGWRHITVKYRKVLVEGQRYGREDTEEKTEDDVTAATAESSIRLGSAVSELNPRRIDVNHRMRRSSPPKLRKTERISKSASGSIARAAMGMAKATAATAGSFAAILSGIVLVTALGIVVLIAGITASPFGILFSNEPTVDAVPLNVAIAQINIEISDKLADIQNSSYDDIDLYGYLPDWREVVSVFACKATGTGGIDVATLTPNRVELLRKVFWDMCTITTEVERTYYPANDATEAWTEKNLDITVEAKTADDMRTEYEFSDYQNHALTELLAQTDMLDALLTDLNISQGEVKDLLQNLPEDLSPERRAVVETACSLVGKVNYFWGGKSLTQGWNSTWGQLRKVTADGSPTADTYRPYGLDCSGFVDWVFYNVSDGEYLLGHGGGVRMQHRYCADIDWEDAQPGDLVFYPDDTHVGIVAGVDANGDICVIHCASSDNNVVISDGDGFVCAGEPACFAW